MEFIIMDKVLNYQASLFGNFTDIKPSTENVKKLLNDFSNFFPSSVTMASIDVFSNKLKYDNRLQLVSNDHKFLITFLVERIDINYSPIAKSNSSLEKIKDTIIDIISSLSNVYADTMGYRLSTSCKLLSPPISESELSEYITKYSNPLQFYNSIESINEWGQRYNSQYNETVHSKEELTNHIISIDKIMNKNQFSLTIDINTVPVNQIMKFNFSDLKEFSILSSKKIVEYINIFENNGNNN